MFPEIEKYIPKIYLDNLDNAMQALINVLQADIDDLENELQNLLYMHDAVRCPELLLNYLGYFVNASIRKEDTELQKRKKIKYAIQSHKKRGTWNDDAKIRIDIITGYSAVIVRAIDSADWIMLGHQATDPNYYWATFGRDDGTDDSLGIDLIGEGTEINIAGNIYIDCHEGINVATLTAETIAKIVDEIKDDIVPAYYRVYLGYINVSNQFIVYAGGVIE